MTTIQSFEIIKKKKQDKQKKLSPTSIHYQNFLKNKVTHDDKKKLRQVQRGKRILR